MNFRKAERKQTKLRIGLKSPSGGGKTRSAIELAHGLAGDLSKVAIIDTESGSADLYSHLGSYNVLPLEAPYNPERYIEAIKICEDNGMEVIIIDSVSHEWEGEGGCLQLNERIAAAKFKGNTWSAWSETNPRHQKFIEAMLTSSAHIITTARSKVETVMTDDKKVKKVGMKEIQKEGFEYELTLAFDIDRDKHYAVASKDRTELFIDADPFVISKKTGEILKAWAESGKEPVKVEKPQPPTPEEIKAMKDRLGALSPVNKNKATQWFRDVKLDKVENATKAQLNELDKFIKPLETAQAGATEKARLEVHEQAAQEDEHD